MQVQSVFHVNLLKAYINPIDPLVIVQLGPIDYIEDDNTFEVDSILDYRTRRYGQGLWQEYLIAWKGYPIIEATWKPIANLTNCDLVINDYHLRTGIIQQGRWILFNEDVMNIHYTTSHNKT